MSERDYGKDEKFQMKPYCKNYSRIDSALQREKELRETTENDITKYRQTEMDKLYKTRWILFAVWIAGIVLLTTIVFFLFSCDTIIIPFIVSTMAISPVIMYFIASVTEDRITSITTYRQNKEIKAEIYIVKMYTDLLHNIDIYAFLGIPLDIKFYKDDLPYRLESDLNSSKPYGSFTRYIAPITGSRYHTTNGCSGAFTPIHVLDLSLNEYRINWRYYTPCLVCGNRDTIVVPQWYIYYRKVKDITSKYEIKVNYSSN